MAKAAFTKKYTISASGILTIDGEFVGVENMETGEMVGLNDLLDDFDGKTVKITAAYDEELGVAE